MKSPSDATVRTLTAADADQALPLYNELTVGPKTANAVRFRAVLDHGGTSVFGVWLGPELVAMVTLHLLPNVVWDGRPYALIENVVTRQSHQKRGFGRMALSAACDAAWEAGTYKIMLMTGKKRGARGFYKALGFSDEDKFAMVMRRP